MKHDMQPVNGDALAPKAAAPSAEFINAISEFFDTDPSDLLVELGYYQREASPRHEPALTEVP